MSVSDDVVAKFTQLATPTIANALDDVGFEGVLSGLAQMVPGTRCVGRAATVREITGRRGDFTSEDFKVGQAIEAAQPGDVLVIDNGGHRVSTFGGLATLAAKLRGVAGLVADGGVRVRPGDVIVADGSGVVCIPAEHAAEVAELALGYARDDEAAAAELRKGLTFSAAMAKFRRI
jgi:regulator of RNase E activity RraA